MDDTKKSIKLEINTRCIKIRTKKFDKIFSIYNLSLYSISLNLTMNSVLPL